MSLHVGASFSAELATFELLSCFSCRIGFEEKGEGFDWDCGEVLNCWNLLELTLRTFRQTAVGYTQGHVDNPTYQQVCSGRTGHAEAVLVDYHPSEVSYQQLVDVFWKKHDPTQKNRQVW